MDVNLFSKIEYLGEEKILVIDAKKFPGIPTIEDNPIIMSYVLKRILESPGLTQITIIQTDEYEYYEDTIYLLTEFVNVYKKIEDQLQNIYPYLTRANPFIKEYSDFITYIQKDYFRDPIGIYIRIKRLERKIETILNKNKFLAQYAQPLLILIKNFLSLFENTKVYILVKEFIPGTKLGNREIYKRLFLADIKPKFIYVEYRATIPKDTKVVDTYDIDKDTRAVIFRLKNSINTFYYIFPPEYTIFEKEYEILNKVREILVQYQPRKEDYLDIRRLREIYDGIISNLLDNVSYQIRYPLTKKRKELLKDILIRYTVGFGILEKIAKDEKVQDIFVNPPPGLTPVSVNHADYDICTTNVVLNLRELESWATKLRLISGRPFDEANPVLDTDLEFEGVRLRVAATMEPLSHRGLSFVFRRHRTKPWTLPLFIANRMISPLAAGLLSFLVDNGRCILFAGTRGAGKTSLLTATLLEIPRKYRIITIEDTLEIPTEYLRKLEYNILPLKVRSPFAIKSAELSAEDGVRVSLRLGDSAIILGEVRSSEAKTLYEAMRVGALANAVMGTIHAESPYGVYDRVVNDLGVPKTSFKATDIVVIANPIKSPDGLKKYRRVLRITEVRKHWEEDPLKERGFVDLMIYDADKDNLLPTKDLLNGDSDILKSIAARVKLLAGSWERVWKNIVIRAKAKELLVNYSKKYSRPNILEADFIVQANDVLHSIVGDIIEEVGDIDSNEIINRYEKWLISEIK